ncbi:hypothetical protein [Streptomyces sp. CC208A]|uniref:hypothetical protein n=1 Tax=Streptomyces sp. CC208A TaxID=3044573 RepID=UPI0024A869A7|nr:hypothetical protein [Streptomyces sp. CC208A]
MTGPSSTPRGEKVPAPGATWEISAIQPNGQQHVPDNAPQPRANRATRRAARRRKEK